MGYRILVFLSLAASAPSAEACLDLAGCQAALVDPVPSVVSFPPCCCENYLSFTAPYATRNACLAANYSATYGGATPAAPATCAGAGLISGAGICPNNTGCTSIVLGNVQCACPAGKSWTGDMCVAAPAPAARGDCASAAAAPTNATPGQWNPHKCGNTGTVCDDSPMPIPVAPPGVTFADLANPMAACCGMGWLENAGAAGKLDCVEAIPGGPTGMSAGPPDTRLNTFLRFYLYVGPTSGPAGSLATAGVTKPNQIFLVDSNKVPMNGFYDQKGTRCPYFDSANAPITTGVDAATQMTMIETALTTDIIPTAASGATIRVNPLCCEVVTFALERKCPENDFVPTASTDRVALSMTSGGVTYRRCTAAKEMKIHFGVFDLCDPTIVKRGRFRVATSFPEIDLSRISSFPVDPVDIQNLIGEFYPSILPLTLPSCPQRTLGSNTSTIYDVPWGSSQMCRLRATEPPFPYP